MSPHVFHRPPTAVDERVSRLDDALSTSPNALSASVPQQGSAAALAMTAVQRDSWSEGVGRLGIEPRTRGLKVRCSAS
ncbi:MAG: hypothetical protein QOF82_745 [Frankiales bacterium]|jgi:hypothetical protein|nr:hypothetical protein [Frankiales bacterium]